MSAGQITDHDCRVILDLDFCYIQDRRMGHDSHRLWELDWLCLPSVVPASLAIPVVATSSTSSFYQWHHRLGHICGSRLSALLCRGLLGSVLGRGL
jgi:hypothetical protein